jgi:hypothetical protein
MINLPSLGIETNERNNKLKIGNFNMINVKVKTNGDMYRVTLKADVPWFGDYLG